MGSDVQNWAEQVLAEARHHAAIAMATEQGRQSSAGALGSTRSAFPMVDIYLEKTAEALDQCLAGISNQVPTRGREWALAFADLDEVLQHHLDQGVGTVIRYLTPQGSVRAIAEKHLQKRRATLHFRLQTFCDGWTAPRPERWIERHPVWWGLITAALGAGLSEVVQWLT